MQAIELELEHRDADQVFSYYHRDHMLHFNATLLARMRKQLPKQCFMRITLDLDAEQYRLCMEHRGIEEAKVAALRGVDLREPGYACLFDTDPEQTFTIIDGHHRLVRRWRGNVRTMDFWVTTREIWKHCLVDYSAEGEALLAQNMPPRVSDPQTILSRVEVKI